MARNKMPTVQMQMQMMMTTTRKIRLGLDTMVETWRRVVGYDDLPKSLGGAKTLAQAIRNGDTYAAYAATAALEAACGLTNEPQVKIYMSVAAGHFECKRITYGPDDEGDGYSYYVEA